MVVALEVPRIRVCEVCPINVLNRGAVLFGDGTDCTVGGVGAIGGLQGLDGLTVELRGMDEAFQFHPHPFLPMVILVLQQDGNCPESRVGQVRPCRRVVGIGRAVQAGMGG